MRIARQIRGELRKLMRPLVFAAVAVVSAATCVVQARHVGDVAPGPSLSDTAGCLRVAALQHATTLGFVLAGVLAAAGTADEAGRGALADLLLQEPSRRRVTLVKLTAALLVVGASILVTVAALTVTRLVVAPDVRATAPSTTSGWTDTLLDLSCSIPVCAFAVALALCIALSTRSVVATMLITVAVFYLPLTVLLGGLAWLAPTRWIIEWLHLDPFGEMVDYFANNSVYDHRGAPAAVSGVLLLGTLIGLTAGLPGLLSRAVRRVNERHS